MYVSTVCTQFLLLAVFADISIISGSKLPVINRLYHEYLCVSFIFLFAGLKSRN